jgi:hypothetical protein
MATTRRKHAQPLADLGYIPPCDPTLHEAPPVGHEWIHEIR